MSKLIPKCKDNSNNSFGLLGAKKPTYTPTYSGQTSSVAAKIRKLGQKNPQLRRTTYSTEQKADNTRTTVAGSRPAVNRTPTVSTQTTPFTFSWKAPQEPDQTFYNSTMNVIKESGELARSRSQHKNNVRAAQLGKPGYGVSTAVNDLLKLQDALFRGGFAPEGMSYEKFVDGFSKDSTLGPNTQNALNAAIAAGYDENALRQGNLTRRADWVAPEKLKEQAANIQGILDNTNLEEKASELYNNSNWFDTALGAVQTAGAFANSVAQGIGKRSLEKLDEIDAPSWLGKGVRTVLDKTIGLVNFDAADPIHGGSDNATYSDKIGRQMIGTVLPRIDREAMRLAHEAGQDYTLTISDKDWNNAGVGVSGDGLIDKAINHPARYTAGLSKVTFKPDGSVVAEDTGDYDFNYEEGGGSGTYAAVRRAAYKYGARESDNDIRKTHYSRTYNILDLMK